MSAMHGEARPNDDVFDRAARPSMTHPTAPPPMSYAADEPSDEALAGKVSALAETVNSLRTQFYQDEGRACEALFDLLELARQRGLSCDVLGTAHQTSRRVPVRIVLSKTVKLLDMQSNAGGQSTAA